jgi:hypothetical protein
VVCAINLGPKKQTARIELRHFNFELGFAVYGLPNVHSAPYIYL